MKKLILIIALILFFGMTTSYAEVYNFGNTDLYPLLQHVFNGTSGHNHDGTNSRKLRKVTALTPAGSEIITMSASAENLFTITPTRSEIIMTTTGGEGDSALFRVLTTGSESYAITWGSGFKSSGSLTTGTTPSKKYVVEFVNDGVDWLELKRTTAL